MTEPVWVCDQPNCGHTINAVPETNEADIQERIDDHIEQHEDPEGWKEKQV